MKNEKNILNAVKREKTIDELIKFRDYMAMREEYFDEIYDMQVEKKQLHPGRLSFLASLTMAFSLTMIIVSLLCIFAPFLTKIDSTIQAFAKIASIAPGIQWVLLVIGAVLLFVVYPPACKDVKNAQKRLEFLQYRSRKLESRNQRHYFSYGTQPPIEYTYCNPQVIARIIYTMQDDETLDLNSAIDTVVKQLVN